MNQPFTQSICQVTTLSPLHLGSGEDYLPTNYVMKDGYLHAFGDAQLAQALGPAGLKRLVDVLGKGDDTGLLTLQNEVYKKSEQLWPLAKNSVWACAGVNQLYETSIGQRTQKQNNYQQNRAGNNKSTDQNQLQIQRFFTNPHNQKPVLTGSAVKGAIRTAWLDHLNQGRNQGRTAKWKDINNALLDARKVEEDPFSLLKISDASYHHSDGLPGQEIWFSVSRKRKPHPERNPASVYAMLECIGAWRSRCFTTDIRFHNGEHRKSSTKAPAYQAQLIESCNRYYLPKLEAELNQLEQHSYLEDSWVKNLRILLAGELGESIRGNKAMILRLGKHSGAEDKTLDGIRSIGIRGKGKTEYRDKTTEIRLAAQHKKDSKALLPFGWVILEFDNNPLTQTSESVKQAAEPIYKRAEMEQQWQQKRQAERLKIESARQEKLAIEAQQREQAEAEERRLQELANQPEQVQVTEALRDEMHNGTTPAGKGLGSLLGDKLKQYIDQAQDWPEEYKAPARALVTEVFAYLEINRKKNKKAKDLWNKIKVSEQ